MTEDQHAPGDGAVSDRRADDDPAHGTEAPEAELLARLHVRVEIAQATGVLVEVFAVPVEVAARVLAAEAARRGATVSELAAEVVDDPAAVRGWRSGSVCSVCGDPGEVRAFGAVTLLVCPQGHGVIRRA